MKSPRYLYKYRSLDPPSDGFAERILRFGELYLAPPAAFNDPFEFRFRLSFEADLNDKVAR